MEQPEKALAETTFRVSLEEYMDFNLSRAEALLGKKKKAFRLTGLLCLAVSLSSLVLLLAGQHKNLFLLFAALFVLAFGAYQIFYFPLLFPWMMKRSVREAYGQSSYLQNDVTLAFYEDCFTEASAEGEKKTLGKEIAAFKSCPLYYQIDLKSGNSVLIPKKALAAEDAERLRETYLGVRETEQNNGTEE